VLKLVIGGSVISVFGTFVEDGRQPENHGNAADDHQ
jgi:hypothetical protein